MKIDGMDASSYNNQIPHEPVKQVSQSNSEKIEQHSKASESTIHEFRNISHMSEYEINELPVSEKFMLKAIESANKAISGADRRIELSVHQKTKEIMIKVVNSETNEIIREIPPEKVLDMVAKMLENAGISGSSATSGLLVDEKR